MTKLSAVFWLVLVLVAGFTTFKVKYAVQDIEDELNRVRRHTIVEQQEVRVLTAEWTYLNQPERLAELNRRFLGLAPIAAKQLQRTIAEIPLRAAPVPVAPVAVAATAPVPVVPVAAAAPDAPPDVLVAATPDPAAPPARAGALPVTAVKLSPAVARNGPRVQLAKAGPASAPGSLDALIARIADAR
jgi:hypothetical protein